MNRVARCFCSRLLFADLVAALVLASFALPAAAAPDGTQSSIQLDKHARRIEKRLEKYRQGTFLDFEFRDSSKTFGSLGQLSSASFEFTDSDSNKMQTHSYDDLVDVKRAKEYIGDGSVHHHIHLLVPVIVGASVAAGGIAAYEVLR